MTEIAVYSLPLAGKRYSFTTLSCIQYLTRTGRIFGEPLTFRQVRIDRLTVREIQAAVCDRFGLQMIDMSSAQRCREIARPRQIAMYLATRLTRMSLPEIGRRFGGRDHTTVIHARRQIEKLRAEDAEIESHVTALEHELVVRR